MPGDYSLFVFIIFAESWRLLHIPNPPTPPHSFFHSIFSFSGLFFWEEGWGLTYTHAGFGCSFLVFRVRVTGGLVLYA